MGGREEGKKKKLRERQGLRERVMRGSCTIKSQGAVDRD